jgi:hypothetical protein
MDADTAVVSGPDAHRFLEIILPGRVKHLILKEANEYSLQQVVGAVKLAAGQCLPEALNHRFFPNL